MEYLTKNLPDALAKNMLSEFIKSILNMKSSLFDLSKDSLPTINEWIEKSENLNIVTRDYVDEEFCSIVYNKNVQWSFSNKTICCMYDFRSSKFPFPVHFRWNSNTKNPKKIYYIKRCSFEFQWESCREMPWAVLTVLINNNICSSMTNSANKFWIRFGYFQLQKHLHLLYQRKCSYNSNIFFQSIPISICFGFR